MKEAVIDREYIDNAPVSTEHVIGKLVIDEYYECQAIRGRYGDTPIFAQMLIEKPAARRIF